MNPKSGNGKCPSNMTTMRRSVGIDQWGLSCVQDAAGNNANKRKAWEKPKKKPNKAKPPNKNKNKPKPVVKKPQASGGGESGVAAAEVGVH